MSPAMFAIVTAAAMTTAPAADPRLVSALEYGADVDAHGRRGVTISLVVLGGMGLTSGAILALAGSRTDEDRDRRTVGVGLISGGIGAVLGGFIALAVAPRGEHEKLLDSVRGGASRDAVEREWSDRAASARSMRTGFGVVRFGLGAAGMTAGTLMMFRDPSRQRDFLATALFSFGIVETLLAAIIVTTPSPIENTYGVYRRTTQTNASAWPVVALNRDGGAVGLATSF